MRATGVLLAAVDLWTCGPVEFSHTLLVQVIVWRFDGQGELRVTVDFLYHTYIRPPHTHTTPLLFFRQLLLNPGCQLTFPTDRG